MGPSALESLTPLLAPGDIVVDGGNSHYHVAWLGHFKQPPRQLIVTHGEEKAALALAEEVQRRMGWKVAVPQYMDTLDLV